MNQDAGSGARGASNGAQARGESEDPESLSAQATLDPLFRFAGSILPVIMLIALSLAVSSHLAPGALALRRELESREACVCVSVCAIT